MWRAPFTRGEESPSQGASRAFRRRRGRREPGPSHQSISDGRTVTTTHEERCRRPRAITDSNGHPHRHQTPSAPWGTSRRCRHAGPAPSRDPPERTRYPAGELSAQRRSGTIYRLFATKVGRAVPSADRPSGAPQAARRQAAAAAKSAPWALIGAPELGKVLRDRAGGPLLPAPGDTEPGGGVAGISRGRRAVWPTPPRAGQGSAARPRGRYAALGRSASTPPPAGPAARVRSRRPTHRAHRDGRPVPELRSRIGSKGGGMEGVLGPAGGHTVPLRRQRRGAPRVAERHRS